MATTVENPKNQRKLDKKHNFQIVCKCTECGGTCMKSKVFSFEELQQMWDMAVVTAPSAATCPHCGNGTQMGLNAKIDLLIEDCKTKEIYEPSEVFADILRKQENYLKNLERKRRKEQKKILEDNIQKPTTKKAKKKK